jgi:hypothetical protein
MRKYVELSGRGSWLSRTRIIAVPSPVYAAKSIDDLLNLSVSALIIPVDMDA